MNIGIIGLGLIGGSLGRALVKKTQHTVYGRDISESAVIKAELLRVYHAPLADEDLAKLDILCVAVYPRALSAVLDEVLPKLKKGATVIDVGGIKRGVSDVMAGKLHEYPHLSFVATHPMAGREFWGVEHSTEGLFERASVILVPVHTDMGPLTAVKEMFLEIGVANVVVSDAATHDEIIAYTSQLAHIASSSFVKSPTAVRHDGFSAGSFRDLTRVAKLNPEMWSQLFIDNADNLVREIDILIDHLAEYRRAIADGDEQGLTGLLADGSLKKEEIDRATRAFRRGSGE